jgi:hypothetical protein
MPEHRKPSSPSLVKVLFETSGGEASSSTESLWADDLGKDRYRLENSPFFAYGYSYQDIVEAREQGGMLFVVGTVAHGGHSTYRLFLKDGVSRESREFIQHWLPMEELGCTYEAATNRLLSIDVPPPANIFAVYALLEEGESTGIWEFEEAHFGHPVERTEN